MLLFVKEQISPHKYKTPQGYLVCVDAVLSRTGKQTYRKGDFFQDCSDAETLIEVDRPKDEVFSREARASFEGMPVVIDHPNEDVTSKNWKNYSVGEVRDVHEGQYKGHDVLLGNLIIRDEDAIKLVESGHYNELSCGYDCEVDDENNPTQHHIRGNHIALCEKGRAGIAKIRDSISIKHTNIRRSHNSVKDADTEANLTKALNALKGNFRIVKRGTTSSGRKRFEFETSDKIENYRLLMDLVDKVINRFDEAHGCTSTYKTVITSNGSLSIAIDVDDRRAHDSVKDTKSSLVVHKRYKDDAVDHGFTIEEQGNSIRVWGLRSDLEHWQKEYDMDESIRYSKIKDSILNVPDVNRLCRFMKLMTALKK